MYAYANVYVNYVNVYVYVFAYVDVNDNKSDVWAWYLKMEDFPSMHGHSHGGNLRFQTRPK